VYSGAAKLSTEEEADKHRIVTEAVHAAGGKICLQILHAGRYAYSPKQVAPSAIQAPINPFKPKELDEEGIEKQIADFVTCASWPSAPATTASKSWVRKATSSTSSSPPTPTTAPIAGAAATRTACAWRWRSCAGSAKR
jgi:hypothetical protein